MKISIHYSVDVNIFKVLLAEKRKYVKMYINYGIGFTLIQLEEIKEEVGYGKSKI